MKESELLKAALREYQPHEFMCDVIEDVAKRTKGTHAAAAGLKARIHAILETQDTITLMNYLRYTNPVYEALYDDYGENHHCEQCYNMRVSWWRDMVAQLEREGL